MKQYIECEQCGDFIRELTAEEQQRVAKNPSNFIMYCRTCRKDMERESFRDEFYL